MGNSSLWLRFQIRSTRLVFIKYAKNKIGGEVMSCELNKDKGGGGVKGKRFQDSFK